MSVYNPIAMQTPKVKSSTDSPTDTFRVLMDFDLDSDLYLVIFMLILFVIVHVSISNLMD